MAYIWIILTSIIGSTVQGAAGFGYAMICMPLWSLAIPFKVASVAEVIAALVMTLCITFKFRKHINYKLVIIPFLSSMFGITIGISVLMSQEDASLQKILGVALIILGLYFMFYNDRIDIRPTIQNSILFGFASGFSAGLFNVGGPIMVLYLLSASKDKMEYNATIQGYFVLSTTYTVLLHLYHGNVTKEVLEYSLLSIVGIMIGATIGIKIFENVAQEKLEKIIYAFIMVMGTILLLK